MHGNVLVYPNDPGERFSLAGLVIPETYDSKVQEGTVVAVGPGRRLDSGELAKPDVEPGDHVMWRSNANVVELTGEVEREGDSCQEEELILIDERALVAKHRPLSKEERKKAAACRSALSAVVPGNPA